MRIYGVYGPPIKSGVSRPPKNNDLAPKVCVSSRFGINGLGIKKWFRIIVQKTVGDIARRRRQSALARRLQAFNDCWPAIVASMPYGYCYYQNYRTAVELEFGEIVDNMVPAVERRWNLLEQAHHGRIVHSGECIRKIQNRRLLREIAD